MEKCIYLGSLSAVSKNSGKPFYLIHIGKPARSGNGYEAVSLFAKEDQYNVVCGIKPLSFINCELVYIKGTNVLIKVEV